MKRAKILILGGAGYIGSHAVKHLADSGYEVVVGDNLSSGHLAAVDSRANFVHCDLLNPFSLRQLLKQYKPEAVIHFAALAYVGESVLEPGKYYYNNVAGTLNLLQAMLDNNIKNIVFSSTCATYGEPIYTPIDEKHPQKPINPYGRTKLMIEQIFQDYEKAYGLKHCSLRYFNAAGAARDGVLGESHSPETHLIPLILKAIKGEIPQVSVFGTDYETPDGSCIRDYIHVEDLAQAHRLALEKLIQSQSSFQINLGTGQGHSVLEIIRAAEKVSGQKCPVRISGRRPGDPSILVADSKKAQKFLGWAVQYTDIEEIVESAWDWELNKRF